MSAGNEWANDADPRDRGCFRRALSVALLAVALVAVTALAVLGGRSEASTPPGVQPLPVTGCTPATGTGVQPPTPVTAVVPSAYRVRP